MTDKYALAAEKLIHIIPRIMRVVLSGLKSGPCPLPMIHYRILRVLHERPMSLSELAREMMISKASLSDTIKLLIDKGWIARSPDKTDARKFVLNTTESGFYQVIAVEDEINRIITEKLRRLDGDLFTAFMKDLDVIDLIMENKESDLRE